MIVEAAVAPEPGEVEFLTFRGGRRFRRRDECGALDNHYARRNVSVYRFRAKRIRVQARTFGSILAEYGIPYYLKLDIEGAELTVPRSVGRVVGPPSLPVARDRRIRNPEVGLEELEQLLELGYRSFKVVSQTEHVDGFEFGASGPFAEETFGEWMSGGVTRDELEQTIRTLEWHDLHARLDSIRASDAVRPQRTGEPRGPRPSLRMPGPHRSSVRPTRAGAQLPPRRDLAPQPDDGFPPSAVAQTSGCRSACDSPAMSPDRLVTFTDGVVAILITILVLELRPPSGDHFGDILDEKGELLAYVLSFVFVAIYWVNHHHLFQVVHRIDGRVLWANILLLFCLSLTPVATAWLGESGAKTGPVAAYALVLIGCAVAYTLAHARPARAARAGVAARDRDRRRPQGAGVARAYVVGFASRFIWPWVAVGAVRRRRA